MSKRIGEALLERGFIDRSQLDNALRTQLFFGGHVGTSMIELGYVDEDTLGETLGETLGVGYARSARFRDIPTPVIDTLSQKMAEKYQAVPIEIEDNSLHVAVINPAKLTSLSVVTGFRIVPWVAIESRIYEAMERYYGIPQRPRFIKIGGKMNRAFPGKGRLSAMGALPYGGDEPPPAFLAEPSQLLGDESGPTQESQQDETDVNVGGEFGYGRSWRDILDEVIEGDVDGRDVKPVPAQDASSTTPAAGPLTLDEAGERMAHAETKDDLSRAVLDFAARDMPRCVLFRVKAETAFLWDARGLTPGWEDHRKMGFPVAAGSIFTLLLGDTQFRGELEDAERFAWFYRALRVDPPKEVLLLPIYLNDRLVGIFYGDGGTDGSIRKDTETYRKLMHKLSLGLNMIILKTRIRTI